MQQRRRTVASKKPTLVLGFDLLRKCWNTAYGLRQTTGVRRLG